MQKLLQNIEPEENEKWQIINYLTQAEKWESMVKDFTELLLPYLDPEEMLQNPPIPNSSFIDKFENDPEFPPGNYR